MSALKNKLVAGSVVLVIGVAVYESRLASRQQERLSEIERQLPLPAQLELLRRERDNAVKFLAAAREENEQLLRDRADLPALRAEVTRLRIVSNEWAQFAAATSGEASNPTGAETGDQRLARVGQLKQWFELMPERKIPELQFLNEKDWLPAAQTASFDADDHVRLALSNVRTHAKMNFAGLLQQALAGYTQANSGALPTDLGQLQSYFASPVEDSVLQRYQILRTGKLADLPPHQAWVAEKAPVDNEHDQLIQIGTRLIHFKEVSSAAREREALFNLLR